jgi:hypothetical protein
MSDPAFFGYGSLVNLATHDYADPRPATLHGWRRVWRGTHLRQVAYLSVMQDATCHLEGVLAKVPAANWTALDAREAAYLRHDVSGHVNYGGPPAPTAVYQVRAEHIADADHPILLSYLDVVVQGYLRIYGPEGVAQFFATTAGWDAPILNDRADPIYPRHQKLTQAERALVDDHLAAMMQQAK